MNLSQISDIDPQVKNLIVELMGCFMPRKKNLAEFTPACCRQVLLVIKLVKGFT